MENFEISDSLVGITKIWEAFFFPIVSTALVFLFIYILIGKQHIYNVYQRYKIEKIDNKYYRQKHIKIKKEYSNGSKKNGFILIPLSEKSERIIMAVQKPIISIIIFLLFAYTIHKTINIVSNLYPINYSIYTEAMLLYSTPKETVAEIWSYFPEYTLSSLCQKIDILGEECLYAKYADYIVIYRWGSIFKFCSILCFLNFFLQKPKINTYFKTIFLFLICLFLIMISFYLEFSKHAKVLEQKAYYVRKQLILNDPTVSADNNAYQIAISKVENELRYIDNNIFYNSFHINIVFFK